MNEVAIFKLFALSLLQVLQGFLNRKRERWEECLVDGTVVAANLHSDDSNESQDEHPCLASL